REHPLGQQGLAEDRCGLRDDRRGYHVEDPAGRGEHTVQAVAEFMGHRHHVPESAGVVEQDVGGEGRSLGLAERREELRRPGWCIDPALIEEARDDLKRARRERAKAVEYELARLGVAVQALDRS